MNDVLKDIANTPLEGTVKYVDTEDKCNNCGYIQVFYSYSTDGSAAKVGDVWGIYTTCENCDKQSLKTVVKATPSKNQDD